MRHSNKTRTPRKWQKKKRGRFSIKINSSAKEKGGRILCLLAIILALASFSYVLFFSDYFKIKEVKVSGVQSISSSEIESAVKNALAESTHNYMHPDNYFSLDDGRINQILSENFREIETIKITKEFPNILNIEVKEKNPALIWCRQNCYLVNEKGVAFLPADEKDASSEQRRFIKIIEEEKIAEETEEEKLLISNTEHIKTDRKDNESKADFAEMETSAAILKENVASIPAVIALNEGVSDESFIQFANDIDSLIKANTQLKIMHYKTKGYKTRELIAFTDTNTKLYFNTLGSAKKQSDNLSYFLAESIEKEKVDALQYVYLKNEDRIFYK